VEMLSTNKEIFKKINDDGGFRRVLQGLYVPEDLCPGCDRDRLTGSFRSGDEPDSGPNEIILLLQQDPRDALFKVLQGSEMPEQVVPE